MSNKVYSRITDEIIRRLEKGTVPWHQPWKSGPESFPVNLLSGKRYRGINLFVLSIQPFRSRYWLTFRQVASLNGRVRQGEKATPVLFWKWVEEETQGPDGQKQVKRLPMVRYYSVFNAEQCEGFFYPKPPVSAEQPIRSIVGAENIVRGYPAPPRIEHRGKRAFYRPLEDAIFMPPKESFESVEEYYSTIFHEMTHSTGHKKRLARQSLMELCSFGSTNYSNEELVAEMGAAMLCGEAGIENLTIDNSASYLAGWLKRLKDDRRLIVTAASQAQRAVDWILNRKFESEEPKKGDNTHGLDKKE